MSPCMDTSARMYAACYRCAFVYPSCCHAFLYTPVPFSSVTVLPGSPSSCLILIIPYAHPPYLSRAVSVDIHSLTHFPIVHVVVAWRSLTISRSVIFSFCLVILWYITRSSCIVVQVLVAVLFGCVFLMRNGYPRNYLNYVFSNYT